MFKLVHQGDFVISLRSFEGGLEYSAHRGIRSPAYTVLAPSEHVVPEFFRYLLKSSVFVQGLAKHKKGIRDGQAVPFATLRDDYLRVPEPATQRRIANFLDEQTARIDALIAEKERLVDAVAEYRRSWLSERLVALDGANRARLKFCLAGRLQYGATESGERDAVGPRYIRITDIAADGSLRDDDVKLLPLRQEPDAATCRA